MNAPLIKISDTDIIQCSNCQRHLMFVYCRPIDEETKNNLEKHNVFTSKVQVDCPYCNDHSYDHEVVGQFRFHPAKGVKITNFIRNEGRVRFKTSIQI